jgi:hypothetical protein
MSDVDLASFASEKFNWMDCLMRDHSLKPGAFKVGIAILQHMNAASGEAWVSDETLEAITGMSRPMVQRHRESLKAAGWLSWVRTRNANRYTPLFDKVNAGLDAMVVERERRKELRKVRREARPAKQAKGNRDASPVMQHNRADASPVIDLDASPVSNRDASPVMHIHLRDNTYEITPKEIGLAKKGSVVVEGSDPEQGTVAVESDAAGADLSTAVDVSDNHLSLSKLDSDRMSDASDKPMGNAFLEMSTSVDKSAPSDVQHVAQSADDDVRHAAINVTHALQAAEQPLPPPLSEPLAEMKLFRELGEGDEDRGCRIAAAIGDARFTYLRRELMRGTLYRSSVIAAARGYRQVAA